MQDKYLAKLIYALNAFDSSKVIKILRKILQSGNKVILAEACQLILKSLCPDIQMPDYLVKSFIIKLETNQEETLKQYNAELPMNLLYYLKFAEIRDLSFLNEHMTIEQLINIRTKDVNKIRKAISLISKNNLRSKYESYFEENHDRLRYFLEYEEYLNEDDLTLKVTFKMLLTLGLENSLDLLRGYYGKIDFLGLCLMFSRCSVKQVMTTADTIEGDKSIIQFLFAHKNTPYNVLKRALNGELAPIFLCFSELYNYRNDLKELFGNNFKEKEVLDFLKDILHRPLVSEPEFTTSIIRDVVKSNNNFGNLSEKEILNENKTYYYEKIYPKIKSSIPRVIGNYADYQYEIMRLDDPNILRIGYLTGNCFRIDGIAHGFVDYYAKSDNMRILLIKDKNEGIIGMVPIVRNGNAIVGNGIEISKGYDTRDKGQKIFNTVKSAFEAIIMETQKSEEPLVLGTITNRNYKVMGYTSISLTHVLPLEENISFVCNFQNDQYMVTARSDYYTTGYNSYVPSAEYMDERMVPLGAKTVGDFRKFFVAHNYMISVASRHLDSKKIFERLSLHLDGEVYLLASSDWFLLCNENGTTYGIYLKKDPRAKEEMEYYAKLVEEKALETRTLGNRLTKRFKFF